VLTESRSSKLDFAWATAPLQHTQSTSLKASNKMRIYNPIITVFAVGCTVVASPLAPVPHTMILAGIVVTDKGVTYQMQHLDEIKTFDAKVDNGEYPYPITYQVAAGYSCVFYL
jgi:hypothetical protein